MILRPFWQYWGSKWSLAPHYSAPQHNTIVEPFAGGAGYSLRYPERNVILVDKYPIVASIWQYLIRVPSAEILHIPLVLAVDDLPAWVPQEARWLVGFCLSSGGVAPITYISPANMSRRVWRFGPSLLCTWSERRRARIAEQVNHIRHWKVLEGDYQLAGEGEATWFIDPPYQYYGDYVYSSKQIDYQSLAAWCQQRCGQVTVCEMVSPGGIAPQWLPFEPLIAAEPVPRAELVWKNG